MQCIWQPAKVQIGQNIFGMFLTPRWRVSWGEQTHFLALLGRWNKGQKHVCAPRRLGGERSPRTLLKYHRHAVTLISGQLLICRKCQCVFCSLKKKGSKKSSNGYYLMDAVYCLLYENYVIDFPWPWMKRALLSMAFLAIILLDCTRLSKIH